MIKKSIYISLACLDFDDELEKTVMSAIIGSSGEFDINFGIACISNFEFYEKTLNRFKDFNNVKMTYTTIHENFGISKHRRVAASLYNNEDYFFQVDCHTYFKKDWDRYVVEKFELIRDELNNDKIVLSGYAGAYRYITSKDNVTIIDFPDDCLGYTEWIENSFRIDSSVIPNWEHYSQRKYPIELYQKVINNGYVPLDKISANFVFGNEEVVKFINECPDFIFWEEEIIQSIELIHNGFNIVYPGLYSPTMHLYSSDITDLIGRRSNVYSFLEKNGYNRKNIEQYIKTNFLDYCNKAKNLEKIEMYEKYSGVSLKNGKLQKEYFIESF